MILAILFAQPSLVGDSNVALDDERLQDNVPKGLQKVELDLDDALFLEFEDKQPPVPPAAPPPEPKAAVPEAHLPTATSRILGKFTQNKLTILGIAAALCLLLGAGGAYFFMATGLQPENQDAEQNQTTTVVKKETSPTDATSSAKGHVSVYSFDRFQVEYTVGGQVRFLICRFAILDANATLRLELQNKDIAIRDGIYHYLKDVPIPVLDDAANIETLKAGIVGIINTFVTNAKVSSVHFEEYVVK